MKKDKTRLSEAERRLWADATADVTPLKPRRPAAAKKAAPRPKPPQKGRQKPPPSLPSKPAARPAAPKITVTPAPRGAVPGLDRRSQERLRKGRLAIDARLDLHGLRQAEAHHRLDRFIAEAVAAGWRCVLVITGKGSDRAATDDFLAEAPGVLRRRVPGWLRAGGQAANVIAIEPARPQHGGDGAFYVLLRRRRAG